MRLATHEKAKLSVALWKPPYGSPHRVHAVPVPAGADIVAPGGFDFTPDGEGIVYLADHDVDEKLELWISDGMVFRADFEWGDLAEWSGTAP